MKQLELGVTGRKTSQLGFGCSSLMSATGRKESLALLDHAFASGIRHFDVAPMYGYGAAESCLGAFLATHTGEVTVATKFGILPPANAGAVQALRGAVRPLLQLFPGVKRRLAGAAQTVVNTATKPAFTSTTAKTALESSLRKLRVESIDLWLLHEVEAEDLGDDQLLRFLEDSVSAGKICTFGAGSSADKIPALLSEKPAFCPVLQFEWSILDQPLPTTGRFTIHHRALTARFADLHSALDRNVETRKQWSATIGADLAQPGTLAALMLKAALIFNPDSVILVSSRNPSHITENVRVAGDDSLAEPARRLFELAQREASLLLT